MCGSDRVFLCVYICCHDNLCPDMNFCTLKTIKKRGGGSAPREGVVLQGRGSTPREGVVLQGRG